MFKKSRFVLICIIFSLICVISGYAQDETLTITTYYPSPYGSYNQLQTYSLGVGDNDTDSTLDSDDVPTTRGDVWIAGNVGIGTTEPNGRLEVVNENPVHGSIIFGHSVNDVHFDGGDDDGFVFENTGAIDGYTIFHGGGLSRLTIRNNGNVGIGTMNPASPLDLGGGCMTGTICSDARMKKNIEPLPDDELYLAKVMRLKGASFEWKNLKDGKRYVGLIAQDVEKVLPEVVMTSDSNEGQKGLSCIGLDAVLVEAIKEQQREIEELKAEIHNLKEKL